MTLDDAITTADAIVALSDTLEHIAPRLTERELCRVISVLLPRWRIAHWGQA